MLDGERREGKAEGFKKQAILIHQLATGNEPLPA